MKKVELHYAFLWVCDNCGKENILVPERVDPRVIEEIAEQIIMEEEGEEKKEKEPNYLKGQIADEFLNDDEDEDLEDCLAEDGEDGYVGTYIYEETMELEDGSMATTRKFVGAYQDVCKCPGTVTCKYCKEKFEV